MAACGGDAELGSPQRGRGGRRDALPLPGGTSFLGHPWQKSHRAAGQAAVPGSPPSNPRLALRPPASRPRPLPLL